MIVFIHKNFSRKSIHTNLYTLYYYYIYIDQTNKYFITVLQQLMCTKKCTYGYYYNVRKEWLLTNNNNISCSDIPYGKNQERTVDLIYFQTTNLLYPPLRKTIHSLDHGRPRQRRIYFKYIIFPKPSCEQ